MRAAVASLPQSEGTSVTAIRRPHGRKTGRPPPRSRAASPSIFAAISRGILNADAPLRAAPPNWSLKPLSEEQKGENADHAAAAATWAVLIPVFGPSSDSLPSPFGQGAGVL